MCSVYLRVCISYGPAYFCLPARRKLDGPANLVSAFLLSFYSVVFECVPGWSTHMRFSGASVHACHKRCERQWKKSLNNIKGTLYYLSKGKPRVISLYTELTSLGRLESESITDYTIRTENISHTLKKARELISDRLLIVMVFKGLLSNFKPFTTVITQKKKTLTFSEFKICLRSYEETDRLCYPPDESNNILQMKTTFKKLTQGINLG